MAAIRWLPATPATSPPTPAPEVKSERLQPAEGRSSALSASIRPRRAAGRFACAGFHAGGLDTHRAAGVRFAAWGHCRFPAACKDASSVQICFYPCQRSQKPWTQTSNSALSGPLRGSGAPAPAGILRPTPNGVERFSALDEIILFDSSDTALQDAAATAATCRRALGRQQGVHCSFNA